MASTQHALRTLHASLRSAKRPRIITKGCECWHPRYDVSNRSFPRNVRFKEKLFAKEFNLLAHCLVEIILELCVMNQMGSFLHRKVYLLYLVCALFGPLLNKEKYQFWEKDRYCGTWETCLQVGTCSQSRHMQWIRINVSADETPNGRPMQEGPIFP